MQYMNFNKAERLNCMDKLYEGRRVFEIEIRAMQKMMAALDDTFVRILDQVINCSGKVIVTGMGKSGHVARKIAATFASLGTPAFCLHPGEAMHGDLGMISVNDIVLAISYSGESDEIVKIIPNIKLIGSLLIGITARLNSTLAKAADIVQILPSFEEACHLGLAPTSSTTVELCYGDALAVAASTVYGFNDSDFAKYHPAGALGKKLILKVKDVMAKGKDIPIVHRDAHLMDAITQMSEKGLGVISVIDNFNQLVGIITDGDLRRSIEKRIDIYTEVVSNVMTWEPKCITGERLAIDALNYIRQHRINNLPVVDVNNHVIGMITWQMIVKEGITI